jgi:hypothetical protein
MDVFSAPSRGSRQRRIHQGVAEACGSKRRPATPRSKQR